MTTDEAQAWEKATTGYPGRWHVDPIHDGENGRRFLAYMPSRQEPHDGIYVEIEGARWGAGLYAGAYPHIGEAMFMLNASGAEADPNAAWKRILDALGTGTAFLIDLLTEAEKQ